MNSENREVWKAVAAYVYITICAFDFLFMPFYTTRVNQQFIEETVSELDPENRSYILEVMDKIKIADWDPVTVSGSGGFVFHLSFGLILGGSAVASRTWTISSNGISSGPGKDKNEK